MRLRASIVVLVLGLCAPPAPAREGGGLALPSRLESRVDRGRMGADQLGVCVISLDTGEVVFARSEDKPLVPASVAKVVTSAAALDLLGPGWRYDTTIDARGTLDSTTGTLTGDLVVHGSGDPNLSKRLHGDDWLFPLRTLADGVVAGGIRKVTGALVLDDGPFDRVYLHPSWSPSEVLTVSGAPVAGLSFNDNCMTVFASGSSGFGQPAEIELPATSGPWIVTNATEVSGGAGGIGGRWIEDGRGLQIFGNVARGRPEAAEIPVSDPVLWFGGALQKVLASRGVAVASGIRAAATPADRLGGRRLPVVVSDTLAETLSVMNHRSQNFYAEILFKTCGAAREGLGSWESGERAVGEVLRRRGISDAGVRVVDGSGLSRDNRLTAGALARLLASMDGDALRGPVLHASLATPGGDGTLEKRLREAATRSRVHAKTGTLKGVHSLAGYVDGTGGSPSPRGYAFAIVLNGAPRDGDPKDLIDDLVREMARE